LSEFISERESYQKPFRDLIQDPVHGFITVEPHEKLFIDSTAFQRLRRIKQLQSVHLVYPGANHTRFEHVVGVMHLTGYFAEKVLDQLVEAGTIKTSEMMRYYYLARLWGLFHDVGHGPFSHAFDNAILNDLGTNHELLCARLIHEIPELQTLFSKKEFKDTGLTADDIAKSQEPYSDSKFDDIEKALLYVIKGPYSADIADFIQRDSYHSGVREYGNIGWQRLVLTSFIRKNKIVLEDRSKAALLSFYFSRHQMFNTVYYHKTCRASDRMIRDIMNAGRETIVPFVENLERYMELDEESLMQTLKQQPATASMVADYFARKIPWRLAYETQWGTSETAIAQMVRDETYQRLLQENIQKELAGDVEFFVDGAYLRETPLSPFEGQSTVTILNRDNGTEEQWNPLSDFYRGGGHAFWIRVFINKKDESKRQRLQNACRKIAQVQQVHM
jgi:HD superfamily phosphohydrolase